MALLAAATAGAALGGTRVALPSRSITYHRLDDVPVRFIVSDRYCPADQAWSTDGIMCISAEWARLMPKPGAAVTRNGAVYPAWRIG